MISPEQIVAAVEEFRIIVADAHRLCAEFEALKVELRGTVAALDARLAAINQALGLDKIEPEPKRPALALVKTDPEAP